MVLQQFVNKWLGKEADFDGFYAGQCVDLFRFYCRDVLKISQPKGVVGAKDFWTNYESDPNLKNNFTKISNTLSFIPIAGDVAIWNGNTGNGFGHIGIVVDDKHTTNYFYSFDQNWSKISFCEIVKHNYNNFYGVLRPKSIPEGDNMSDMYNGYDLSNKESMKVAVDVLVRVQKGEFVEKSKLDELVKVKTAELSSKISNYEEEIKGLNVQISLLKKDKQDQAVQIKSLQENITILNNELENCVPEIPGQEDLEQNYEVTGKKIIKQVGDTTVETTYKVKE